MRKPDFGALRYALEQGERVDFCLLRNAIIWCCGNTQLSDDAQYVMATLIDHLGPQVRLQQGKRNAAIANKLRKVDRFHTTLLAERASIGAAEGISAIRVEKIQQGQCADPTLAAFIQSVMRGLPPRPGEVVAAKRLLKKLLHRMMGNGSKAEALRAKISTGFGRVGKSALGDECFDEIERMVVEGSTVKDAIQAVADCCEQSFSKVETAYHRQKRQMLRDLDAAISAANAGNVMTDAATGTATGRIGPPISRKDLLARHTLAPDEFS